MRLTTFNVKELMAWKRRYRSPIPSPLLSVSINKSLNTITTNTIVAVGAIGRRRGKEDKDVVMDMVITREKCKK